MNSLYDPCPCESGKKFKFCCFEAMRTNNHAHLEKNNTKIARTIFLWR